MNDPVVVGAGPPPRAGGVDLFLELVAAISTRAPAEFVWVGERPRGVAHRLDAEIEAFGGRAQVDWRARGSAPAGPEVVLVVTARSQDAARAALSEVATGTRVVGLESDPDVTEVLRAAGSPTVRYPDVAELAERILSPGEPDTP